MEDGDLSGLMGPTETDSEYAGTTGDESSWAKTIKSITGVASGSVGLFGQIKAVVNSDKKIEPVTAPTGGSVLAQGSTGFSTVSYVLIGVGALLVGLVVWAFARSK